jgi:regulator of replication initiation timing
LGENPTILTWSKAVIRRLADKIKNGTKFFINHGEKTNSHDGRKSVGEVLTSFVKDIGGRLSNVIIGHFPDADIVRNKDVCSMEADIYTNNDYVDDVDQVTAVALGNSNVESPAFPGAFRLNTVQCFGTEDKKQEGDKDMPISFQDVKKAVSEMNIRPRQLFSTDDLKDDREFGKVFEKNSTLQAENERLKKQSEDLEKSSKEAIRFNEISKAKNKIDTLMKEGFTDVQRKFIKGRFKPENLEGLSDDDLNKHLENEKKVFAETAKLFGSEVVDQTTKSNKGSSGESETTLEDEALKIIGV